jgi:hypothetical protein
MIPIGFARPACIDTAYETIREVALFAWRIGAGFPAFVAPLRRDGGGYVDLFGRGGVYLPGAG